MVLALALPGASRCDPLATGAGSATAAGAPCGRSCNVLPVEHLIATHRQTRVRSSRVPRRAVGPISGALRLVRVENVLIVLLLTMIGAGLGATGLGYTGLGWMAVLIPAFTVAVGNVVNDLVDADLDAIGRPWRAIPSGHVSQRVARRIHILGSSIVVLLSVAVLSPPMLAFALLMLATAYAYSYALKGVPLLGNLAVAFQVAAVPYFGGMSTGAPRSDALAFSVGLFGAFVVFEVAKTASDRWYDQLGIRTIATVLSSRGVAMVLLGVSMLNALVLGFMVDRGSLTAATALLLMVPLTPILWFSLLAVFGRRSLDGIEQHVWLSKALYVAALLTYVLR